MTLAGKSRPVAADLTAPEALLVAETHPKKFALPSLLHTDKFTKSAKVVMVAPYRINIDTLRPESRSVVAMNRLPIASSVTYYSIIGDRGYSIIGDRGGNNSPNSSDGVVPYSEKRRIAGKHRFFLRCRYPTREDRGLRYEL